MPLVQADLRSYVMRQLGSSTIGVALVDADIDDCITDALEFFGSHLPREVLLTISGTGNRAFLAAGTYGRDVISVDIEQQFAPSADVDIFNPLDLALLSGGGPMGNYPDLAMVYQGVETAKAVHSAEFAWEFFPGADPATDQGTLYYSPELQASRKLSIRCVENWTIVQLPVWAHPWIKKHTKGGAKQVLGLKRRKHGVIQGTHNQHQLDGAELVQEGRADVEAAEEWLLANKRSHLHAPITGI